MIWFLFQSFSVALKFHGMPITSRLRIRLIFLVIRFSINIFDLQFLIAWIANVLKFLVTLLVLFLSNQFLIGLQPLMSFGTFFLDCVTVWLEAVLRGRSFTFLYFQTTLCIVIWHQFLLAIMDFVCVAKNLFTCYIELALFVCWFFRSDYVQNAVGINVKCDLDLWIEMIVAKCSRNEWSEQRTNLKTLTKLESLTWGSPFGAGWMPVISNAHKKLLSLVIAHSPSNTWINALVWLSECVVNVCVCLVGMVVLRLIKTLIIPPTVLIPNENGVASNKTKSWIAVDISPLNRAAWTEAPQATNERRANRS